MRIKGKAWKFGDNVDTDAIIAARHLVSTDPKALARHLLDDVRQGFAQRVRPGDIIVGGKNFGCGSSREHAPLAIRGAGISAVVAVSFARIFYRNAVNMGLPIFECAAAHGIQEGDEVEIDADAGWVINLTQGKKHRSQAVPPFMQKLIAEDGLINYVVGKRKKQRTDYE